jgi:hypothetical protein
MSFEQAGAGSMGEMAAQPGSALGASPEGDGVGDRVPSAIRLQVLATEHWGLLATRSMVWNEVFSRAGMFLSLLSGAIVALALVGQGSGFGSTFALFGIVILPVVLFIGVTTFFRMGLSNEHDAWCVIGMNRIRAAYVEMVPDVERYFVTSAHDDMQGVGRSMGVGLATPPLAYFLSATPVVVMVVNGVLSGAIAGLVAAELGLATAIAVALSAIAFVVAFCLQLAFGRWSIRRAQQGLQPMFPAQRE